MESVEILGDPIITLSKVYFYKKVNIDITFKSTAPSPDYKWFFRVFQKAYTPYTAANGTYGWICPYMGYWSGTTSSVNFSTTVHMPAMATGTFKVKIYLSKDGGNNWEEYLSKTYNPFTLITPAGSIDLLCMYPTRAFNWDDVNWWDSDCPNTYRNIFWNQVGDYDDDRVVVFYADCSDEEQARLSIEGYKFWSGRLPNCPDYGTNEMDLFWTGYGTVGPTNPGWRYGTYWTPGSYFKDHPDYMIIGAIIQVCSYGYYNYYNG